MQVFQIDIENLAQISTFDKPMFGQMIKIHSLKHFMVHVNIINAYSMCAENVCFFFLTKGSHKDVSTLKIS